MNNKINTKNPIIAQTLGLGALKLPEGRPLKFLKRLYKCDLTEEEKVAFKAEVAVAFDADSIDSGQGWSSGTVMVCAKKSSLGDAVSVCIAEHSRRWNHALRNKGASIDMLIAMASNKCEKGEDGPRLNYRFMCSIVKNGTNEAGDSSKAYDDVKEAFLSHIAMVRREEVVPTMTEMRVEMAKLEAA